GDLPCELLHSTSGADVAVPATDARRRTPWPSPHGVTRALDAMTAARRDCGGATWLLLLAVVVLFVSPAGAQSGSPSSAARTSLEVPQRLRLLVVAPHPDDETLGAAGLMQRVQEQHGRVSVAYLTSVDGYVDGVELETHRLKPRPQDFVDYGERRLHEALRALQALSVSQKRLFAFGFPDGGLLDLLTTSWSSVTPFVSPYTRDDR